MQITWVDFKGKKILYADYRQCGSAENLTKLLDEVIAIVKKTANVLIISNFEGEIAYPAFIERIKLWGKDHCQKNIIKSAVIGISGIRMVYYNTYIILTGDKKTKAFGNYNSAVEWLTS
jgi:hypothetical protein